MVGISFSNPPNNWYNLFKSIISQQVSASIAPFPFPVFGDEYIHSLVSVLNVYIPFKDIDCELQHSCGMSAPLYNIAPVGVWVNK